MLDVDRVASQIDEAADPNAIIILGTSIKEEMKDEIAVTVIAAGFEKGREEAPVIPERPAMETQPEPVTKAAVPRHTADFSKTADYDIPDFLKQK